MLRALPADRMPALATDIHRGLSASEVEERRQTYGSNIIAEEPPSSWRALVKNTAKDPMISFLILTSILFGIIGQTTDMAVLLLAVLPLVGMDFYLHRRTQISLQGLSSVLSAAAKVLRDGSETIMGAEELVPGDIAIVESGESFPADGLIAGGRDLQAEESSLTGEAYPVGKYVLGEDRPLDSARSVDRSHWGFAGTRLLTGRALLLVVLTGKDTLYGEIVKSAIEGPEGQTPLQQSVASLVKVLLGAATIFCLFLAIVRLYQGFGPLDAFLSAATLAVAAIPEEFPVVLTFFLGVGVYRLAKRQTLVRHSIAVENIGRVSVICSDKTGTITEGRLSLRETNPAAGYDRARLLKVAAAASRRESGDPLDAAILNASAGLGADWKRLHLFPFTEGRRRETAIWSDGSRRELVAVKGAGETILDLCRLEPGERADWDNKLHTLSQGGMKVIACASLERPGEDGSAEPIEGFRFAGLLAFSDPLRRGVVEAVAEARRTGIRVIMVTGDHPETAAFIAREAGIATDCMVSGDMIGTLIKEADPAFGKISVVARATPDQKLALVRALQAEGEIVAVTGDGVNDVPSLKAADIGIAMGMRGTRSAREVSAIILLDDNFKTIVSAIAEGRQLFRNLKSSFTFLLMIHIPLVATAAIIPLMGYPLLYLPVHIVWLELMIHPGALLAFQLPLSGPLEPRRRETGFFGMSEWVSIAGTGLALTIALTAAFVWAVKTGYGAEHARSVALVGLATGLVGILSLLTRLRGQGARFVVAGSMASAFLFPQVRAMADLLYLHPLTFGEWSGAAAAGLIVSAGSAWAFQRVTRPYGVSPGGRHIDRAPRASA